MKILIVEDDATKISEVSELLVTLGADVAPGIEVASTGIEAREKLSGTHYDLLILDIMLPFRTGDEADRRGGMTLLSEITASSRGRFIVPNHVVALTGFAELREEFEEKYNNGQWAVETYDASDVGWRDRLKAKAQWILKNEEQAGKSFEIDLCVLTALASPELDSIRSLPWGWSEPYAIDGVSFTYRGSIPLDGRALTVAAVACPRMGMVASAALTQKIVCQLRPRMLVMTGICAGVKDECALGDVLVVDPSWDWQMGKFLREAFEIAPDQISIGQEISQRFVQLKADRRFFVELAERYEAEKPNSIPVLHVGPVASGSAVLASEGVLETIKLQNRKVLGVDMEVYGVYSSARDSGPPRPVTFGIKAVCDFADHLKNDKYQKYASYLSAKVLEEFIRRFGRQIVGR